MVQGSWGEWERDLTERRSGTTAVGRAGRLGGVVARPRTPGAVYAVMSVVLVVLVGALALTARQTPPPTIAEFAPQAVEQITESSRDRGGTGAGASGENAALDEVAGAADA